MRSGKIHKTIRLLLMLLPLCAPWGAAASDQDTIRIGVLATSGFNQCEEKWRPTADYLSHMVSASKFKVIPLAFSSLAQVVNKNKVDFILTNSATYLELKHRYHIKAIATLINQQHHPDWPLVKLPDTPVRLSDQVVDALLRMKADDPAAKAVKAAGWAPSPGPQEVGTNPYDPNSPQGLGTLYHRHKPWIAATGITLMACLISAAALIRLNSKLISTNADLRTEIGKRTRTESELRASQQRMQTIVDRSIAGIVIIDPATHTIVDANQSALEMIGADRDKVVGRTCHGFICPSEPGRCPVTDLGEIIDRSERVLIRIDGSRHSVLKTVIPLSLGGPQYLLSNFIDMSQLKQSQLALETALSTANRANLTKTQFLTQMSHELRTPMNGIIGMTGILLDTPMNAEQQDFARTINTSAQGLLRLINDILDFSKIETGNLKLASADFELAATIKDIAQTTLAQANQKGLDFKYDIDTKIPAYLKGDSDRLTQIIENLLNNAVKFSHQGGIFMQIALQGADQTHCTLRFTVKDTGIGIAPEQTDRIFASFFQADGSFTRQYSGAGLGLTIARHLTQMMGGELGVDSVPEKGSTFWFTVKLEVPPVEQ